MKLKNLLLSSLIFLLIANCGKKEEDVIKIAAILPLTGSAAIWGQNVKNGIELANDYIKAKNLLPGKKINIIYEDSKGLPQDAVSALQKLISEQQINIIIGDVASSSVLAMAPIANNDRVILLSPGASNPDITQAGDYVFRNWHSDASEGDYLAGISFNKLNIKNIAIVYVNNGYGKGLEKVFKEKFTQLGGKILISEGFEQGTTDFRSILTKVKNLKPQGIFLPGYPTEIPEILKQAKQLKVDIQFICPSAFEDQQTLDIAGNAANGVIYDYPKQGDTTMSNVRDFYLDYQKKYNKMPGALSDTGFDALMLIVEAMKKSGFSINEIKRGLYGVKNFHGVSGNISFDMNGDIVKEFILKTVSDNKFIGYK